MTEGQFQEIFIEERYKKFPNHVFVPFLELKYNIGKYHKGKEFGMPDTKLDVVEFDKEGNFHLWELKLIDNPEAWNGKFFGQIMLYDFLFSSEPWNELLERFERRNCIKSNGIKGDVAKILSHLVGYGNGEKSKDGDRVAEFSTWNLVVCGGKGTEIASGYNPVAWTFWVMGDDYFKENKPKFHFHQFYKNKMGHELITIPNT